MSSGVILLCGLFVYDVFWVFGTEVMVSVAKGLNAPVKILFPKALGVKPIPCSMLGLGDIVIPGIFVALMLNIDSSKGLASRPYFVSNLIAYELGLLCTVGVMHVFDAAQPALLYLVRAYASAASSPSPITDHRSPSPSPTPTPHPHPHPHPHPNPDPHPHPNPHPSPSPSPYS